MPPGASVPMVAPVEQGVAPVAEPSIWPPARCSFHKAAYSTTLSPAVQAGLAAQAELPAIARPRAAQREPPARLVLPGLHLQRPESKEGMVV